LHKDEIDEILTDELNPLKGVIALSMEYSNLKSRLKDIEIRILDKKREITGFDENKKQQRPKLNYDSNIPKEKYDELCDEIKKTLIEWGFVGVTSVTFDAIEQDIMINGTGRKTNGKGFRAFFYAAFAVSLMNYLLSKEHPFTRVLVLDSAGMAFGQGIPACSLFSKMQMSAADLVGVAPAVLLGIAAMVTMGPANPLKPSLLRYTSSLADIKGQDGEMFNLAFKWQFGQLIAIVVMVLFLLP